ncbi:MAG TPA: glycosyltransferase [Gemmatimonadaceae bacterium]
MSAAPAVAHRAVRSGAPRPRLVIFTTHPIQYQAPLFRELASRESFETIVLFGSRHGLDVSLDRGFGATFQWDIPLLEGYEHEFVENVASTPDVDSFTGIRVNDARGLLQRLDASAVLVLGWQAIAHLQFMRAARALGIPLFIRGESNLLRRLPRGPKALLRSILWLPVRELLYRAMFSAAQEFLVIGTRNAEFYRHFGVPDARLRWAPYAVDNARFALEPSARAAARGSHRDALGIAADAIAFIVPAKIIERKRPFDALAAFATVAAEDPRAHLIYLGDGPERARLETAIRAHRLSERVSITGFVNQRAIPGWYATGDCVMLLSDSRETWGLAINEGMAGGLAPIVSDAVGCAPDLVRPGENGFTYPLGDVGALAAAMRSYLALSDAERAAMALRSREIIAGYTVAGVADAIAAAVADRVATRGASPR